MSDCERHEPLFEAYVAGEVDESGIGPLLAHGRDCEACRRLLELHRDLAALAARAPQPDAAELEAVEARVLRRVEGRAGSRAAAPARPARGRFAWAAYAAAALAAGALLFSAGIAAGRRPPGTALPPSGPAIADQLVRALRADAVGNRGLTDVADSRFTYSDVSLRRMGDDRVALDFDVTTHLHVVERAGSELVQDVLAQALLDPSSTGARLKATEMTSLRLSRKTKEALLVAMRRDPSLAVRLGALSALSGRLDDPEIEAAVLASLRDDDAVQMRLTALDALAAHRVDPALIRDAIREKPRPGGEALEVRLAGYDKRL